METSDARARTRRRHEARLGRLRRHAALASALGFVAFLGLAGQHAVGSTKRAVRAAPTPVPTSDPTTYFDQQQSDGFAFDDGSAAPLPPIAQTNVS